MVALKISRDGFAMNFADDAVVGLSGPRPSDTEILSYVFVGGYNPIGTLETLQSLMDRLSVTPKNFALLTRPNATHVWIRGKAITEIRDPLGSELQDPPAMTRSVVVYANFHQGIQESINAARPIIETAGGKAGLFDNPG